MRIELDTLDYLGQRLPRGCTPVDFASVLGDLGKQAGQQRADLLSVDRRRLGPLVAPLPQRVQLLDEMGSHVLEVLHPP